jgi:hypothetical protein
MSKKSKAPTSVDGGERGVGGMEKQRSKEWGVRKRSKE